MIGKKTLISVILVAGLAYYFSLPKSVREGKVVETKSGSIRGIISTSRDGREFYQWLGIPYAKPPVGKLRFASPEPIGKWIGVRDGSNYGNPCIQNDFMFSNTVAGDEDCLFLNINVPKLHDGPKTLPVLFYVHAGAYILGSSDQYTPEYFMDEDIIFVSINYRLDILGFLSTGDKVIRGNMGLKDQTQALKWIKENIQYFGGDASKITIAGHSAGGASVHQLLLSPMTKGLFHKAISHSGAASNTWGFMTPDKSIKKTRSIAQALGCPIESNEELAECLRSADINDLMGTVWNTDKEMPLFNPHKFDSPVVPSIEAVDDDDAFLTQHPLEVIAQGKANRIPWMVGHTSHEGFGSAAVLRNDKNALQQFENNLEECIKSVFSIDSSANETADEKAAKVRDFYLPTSQRSSLTLEKRIEIYSDLLGDAFFNFDIRESIFYQRQFAPVYPYFYGKTNGPGFGEIDEIMFSQRWTRALETMFYFLKIFVTQSIGLEPPEDSVAVHATDLLMLFPCLGMMPASSKHYEFSKKYVQLVVNFATTNDASPVSFQGVEFSATPQKGQLKVLEITNNAPRVVVEPYQQRMDFLHSLRIREMTNDTLRVIAEPYEERMELLDIKVQNICATLNRISYVRKLNYW